MWSFFVVLLSLLSSIRGGPFFIDNIDQCKDICSDSYFLLPLEKEAQSICQRGCRFFNLIDLKDEKDLNSTKKECYMSCTDSYKQNKLQRSCITGCDTMSKKKAIEIPDFFVLIEQGSVIESQDDSFESDLLSDPMIRNQLLQNDYKIPETYIRTMPINQSVSEDAAFKITKRWLCFYWYHMVTFCLAGAAILSIAMPIIWLAKRREIDDNQAFFNWLLYMENGEEEDIEIKKEFDHELEKVPEVVTT